MANEEKFVRFFGVVQKQAQSLGCIFFIGDTEGNEFETDDMSGENMSGWLVPFDMCDEFETSWMSGDDCIPDVFWDFYTMVELSGVAETPSISFRKVGVVVA